MVYLILVLLIFVGDLLRPIKLFDRAQNSRLAVMFFSPNQITANQVVFGHSHSYAIGLPSTI